MVQIAETHRFKEWPSVADFVKAADIASIRANKHVPSEPIDPDREWKIDPDRIAAKRINNREAVAEEYINGVGSIRLMNQHGITRDQLEPYKRSIFFNAKSVWGDRMAQEYIDRRAARLSKLMQR